MKINGRGQAEVENLVRDVRRREEEGGIRELLAQIVTQGAHIFLRVLLARLECDLNITVGVGDRRGVAKGQIDTAVRQANVVDDQLNAFGGNHVADFALDGSEVLLGILQAKTLGWVDMQVHLAGVDVGEEVAANEEEHG